MNGMTLNQLIERAKEKGIDFDMPILWRSSDHGTDYVEIGMSDFTEEKGKGSMQYLGRIKKGHNIFSF